MRLLVTPARRVPAVLKMVRVNRILSLASPDASQPDLSAEGREHRILRFNDIVEPQPLLVAPSHSEVRVILDSARGVDTLLIHCHAGVSRSTAALFIIACHRAPATSEQEFAQRLRQASPQATPNKLMVALADEMLGRAGQMVAAIDVIGRGEDAFEGAVIDWRL